MLSGGGSHSARRRGEDRDPIDQPTKNKKMRMENIGEMSHCLNVVGRETHSPSKQLHKRSASSSWDGRVQDCDIKHKRIGFENKGRNIRGLPPTTGDRHSFPLGSRTLYNRHPAQL